MATLTDNKPLIMAGAALTAVSFLAYRKYCQVQESKKSLLERVGGEPAVEAAVNLFYKKMLADNRVKAFFEKTNMAHQIQKQRNFLLYILDGGNRYKYKGLAMDHAHRRLVRDQGLSDLHFDATAENLSNTLIELGVAEDVRKAIMGAFESLREQVLCRGKWSIESAEEKAEKKEVPAQTKTLYERIGGEPAVEAAVDKFYKRMLADDRVAHFFKDTNMIKQHMKQVNFISYALGAPKKYSGLAMDAAHRRLVEKQGMNDSHFDAVCENLDLTFQELGVPKDIRQDVATALEGMREQVMCRGKWAKPSN